MSKDKRIDAYIKKSVPFAKPILNHLRKLIHTTNPDIEETMKWGFPHFDFNGSTVCSMASFKQHCAFGFWKAAIMKDPDKILAGEKTAMGNLGQIKSLSDLPPDKVMLAYLREAVRLNKEGIKLPAKKSGAKKDLKVPDFITKALSKNKKAQKTFEDFSYSNKKEYVEWITEAKSEDTRNKRLQTAIEWMAEGKIKNWKYVRS
jgi:uncharacterized protein YdeI (YjbR/CyaY-like superfamily)